MFLGALLDAGQMRIAHIIDSLNPSQGGPPVSTLSLAAAQAALGCDVTIVSNEFLDSASHLDRLLCAIPASDRLTINLISQKNFFETHLGKSARKFFSRNVLRWDILHLHGLWRPMIREAARSAIEHDSKWGLAPRGMLHPWAMQQKRWKKRLALELEWRELIRHAAFLHVLNTGEKAYVDQLLPDCPTEILPNGVFPEKMSANPDRLMLHSKMYDWTNRDYILFLGRLHLAKGLDYLADAFALVAQRNPDIALVVAGPDAGMQQQFEARVRRLGLSSRIYVTGSLYGDQKYAALRNAICLCQPSRQEAFSMTVVEALSCGVPVVISKGCHFPEVEEVDAGHVVEPNAGAIANALLHVVTNSEWRKTAGHNARALVEEKFLWPMIAQRSLAIYERLTNSSQSDPS